MGIVDQIKKLLEKKCEPLQQDKVSLLEDFYIPRQRNNPFIQTYAEVEHEINHTDFKDKIRKMLTNDWS